MADLPVYKRLYEEPFAFDFFQAVRLLGRMPDALARADAGTPHPEAARFRGHLSLSFPASAVHDLVPAAAVGRLPEMTVTFLGLFGPSGVLPRHYTEHLIALEPAKKKAPELGALRAWLDLFNHRFTDLFYRAWEKYRFPLAHERGGQDRADPDGFTRALLSYAGLGTPWLRDRLRVAAPAGGGPDRELAKVHDLGVLRFAGLLAQQHRNAWGLGALLAGYFGVPVEVRQFQGQWLPLEPADQTRVGADGGNCGLGVDAVAGDRVWDVQGKIRLRVGPLRYNEFLAYLPDPSPVPERKAFFLFAQVARLYAGSEFDFDVQLVLRAADVPACELTADPARGPRLGWNAWLLTGRADRDAGDAVFDGEAVTRVGGPRG